ncbi:hypothetical protein R75461_07117 [Paraburkholderia nemoris]|jgi:hypothetical protein|uniref:mating pair formation protein n=1 Tax=Paraburkholderia nemoris TaxID=2793076 RepID=UPI00190CC694|nr:MULTISPECIES: mating pair formation protein [Paraburkholderia]CAE6843124.1 hypothetical protein R75461_07117 [Paraburkholderia nemoris]
MGNAIIGTRTRLFFRAAFRNFRARTELRNCVGGLVCTLLLTVLTPEFANAMDYSTGTGLVRDFVSWLFIDAGPYVFMAILGICVLGVPKGWIPMKGAVIAVVCSFVFFAVPSIVRYAASVASSQI